MIRTTLRHSAPSGAIWREYLNHNSPISNIEPPKMLRQVEPLDATWHQLAPNEATVNVNKFATNGDFMTNGVFQQ